MKQKTNMTRMFKGPHTSPWVIMRPLQKRIRYKQQFQRTLQNSIVASYGLPKMSKNEKPILNVIM